MSSTDDGADKRGTPQRTGDTTDKLIRQLDATRGRERQRLCDEIITATLPVADRLAARYRNRGIPLEDLRQVARAALVQAMRRFHGAGQQSFLAYAVPCIRGELRRYFRDQGWMVRPPRRIQEARLAISAARDDLCHSLGREPTLDEIADCTGIPVDTVREARAVGHCYRPDSLNGPVAGSDTEMTLGDSVGEMEEGFGRTEAQAMIRPLLATLSPREHQLVYLRFFRGLTQSEVGQRIGVSQMQVSRIEARILRDFRETLAAA